MLVNLNEKFMNPFLACWTVYCTWKKSNIKARNSTRPFWSNIIYRLQHRSPRFNAMVGNVARCWIGFDFNIFIQHFLTLFEQQCWTLLESFKQWTRCTWSSLERGIKMRRLTTPLYTTTPSHHKYCTLNDS